jgi:serine/threonine protein kinase
MSKVFTITEGLENLGAIKTGGQGSVYKGRRNGTTITAVKLLPTPIYSESGDDKNYIAFQNEVQKLRKVNEVPNPHVVTILNAGITETGNFPFIEMEFIEGPDLEELIKPPHDPLFGVDDAVKVALHISAALAHCHGVGVKHGDIKTNNIKLDHRTGQYVLLDFGLAAMSDEQRRTSLRHAGAIEFMAPEQNEGLLLFESDVYSFGIVLYELLAGQVPFPLTEKGEMARNTVMISHLEVLPPDLPERRQSNLPDNWDHQRKLAEMQVPAWLVRIIRRCLEKDPTQRFENGIALHQAIVDAEGREAEVNAARIVPADNSSLPDPPPFQPIAQEILESGQTVDTVVTARRRRPVAAVLFLVLLTAAGVGAYTYLRSDDEAIATDLSTVVMTDTGTRSEAADPPQPDGSVRAQEFAIDTALATRSLPDTMVSGFVLDSIASNTGSESRATADTLHINGSEVSDATTPGPARYRVRDKAFFHNAPDESTRRDAFIVHWNNATLTPLQESGDFVYVVFTNTEGQTSRGWLRKKDLERIGE